MLDKFPKDVKIVAKQYPISSHPFAFKAAMAALAAHNQGKFWPFHKALLKNHNSLNDAKIRSLATTLELNLTRFETDTKSPANRALILIDHQEGRKIGVSGTPSVFINGKKIKGRQLGNLFKIVSEELASLSPRSPKQKSGP